MVAEGEICLDVRLHYEYNDAPGAIGAIDHDDVTFLVVDLGGVGADALLGRRFTAPPSEPGEAASVPAGRGAGYAGAGAYPPGGRGEGAFYGLGAGAGAGARAFRGRSRTQTHRTRSRTCTDPPSPPRARWWAAPLRRSGKLHSGRQGMEGER